MTFQLTSVFSENVALEAQDEVEAAHWTTKQITLHLVYLVGHAEGSAEQNPILMKESLIILSDCLLHNADKNFNRDPLRAVNTFMRKGMGHTAVSTI